MNARKKFNLSVCVAIYGFVGAISFPLMMGLKEGFDSTVPDSAIGYIVIQFVIAIIGLIMAIVNYKKMSTEKLNAISNSTPNSVCDNCKTNVKPGTEVCPKCGSVIK